MCTDEKEYTALDALNAARKAQQRYLQTHDVQLEIDLDPEDDEVAEKT